VDSAGNAYVTGYTTSTNFPVTSGAFQTACNGGSGCATFDNDVLNVTTVFVSKLNPSLNQIGMPPVFGLLLIVRQR
jgi:hypothetical protein